MPPALTYLLLIGCGALFVFGFWLEGKKRIGTRFERARRFAWMVQLAAVACAYLVLRPGHHGDPRDDVKGAMAARAPVFLDFYSNY